MVKSDGRGSLSISLPREDEYMTNTCGFCGNFDDAAKNDWIVGPYALCASAHATSIGTVVSTAFCLRYMYIYADYRPI